MPQYRAEYTNGACREFSARNDKKAVEKAFEVAMAENLTTPYAIYLLDEDGNEIKRL